MRKTVRTERAPMPAGAYSQAVISGRLVFTAGQIGIDPGKGTLATGARAQTAQALENIANVLREAGSGLDWVIRMNLYITDMADFEVINGVYSSVFSEPYPARSVVEVAALPLGAVIEMEAVAEVERGST